MKREKLLIIYIFARNFLYSGQTTYRHVPKYIFCNSIVELRRAYLRDENEFFPFSSMVIGSRVRVVKHHMAAFLFRRGNGEWGRRCGYLLHYLRKSGLLRWSLLSFYRGYRGGGSYVSRNDSSRATEFVRETESNLLCTIYSDIFSFFTFTYLFSI